MNGVNPRDAGAPAPHRLLVPGLIFVAMVVAVVGSLGAPLIPTIAEADHISAGDAQWALTIVFLVAAVATPLAGRLGDGPHRRRVIVGSLACVTAGAVLAALPLGFTFLLVGRALQGIGLVLTPLCIAAVRDALPPERARPAAAVLSVTTVVGIGLGYPITGLIAKFGGLHVAFWFGAVVGALGLTVAAIVVPPARNRTRHPVDLSGAVLLGAALVGFLLALSEGDGWGWTSPLLLGVLVASVLALAGFVVRELRAAHPLVELRLLRHNAVLTADAVGILAGVGMYLPISLVTRLIQTPASSGYGLGGSVFLAGLALTPFSAASAVSTRLTRAAVTRISSGAALALGSVVGLLALAMLSFAHGSLWEIFVAMALAGLGVGAIFAVVPGLIVGSVPLHETGSATSFNQVIRYVGYAAGSTLSAVVLAARTPSGSSLPVDGGYTEAGLIGCAMWIATAVVALLLPRLRDRMRDASAIATVAPGDRVLADEGLADAEAAGPVPLARTSERAGAGERVRSDTTGD
ncbi:MFS transporter [Streptomyces sp. DW26H14]|uniref:MFS transporter n=1 Tax=Streptomyces sp. DW26H14 TaxID=3435395 RepID=UPI00403E0FA1